jgi:hypothetical protein
MRTVRSLFFALFATFILSATSGFAVEKETKTEKIDVNSATAKEIATLPGIGEVYSKKIVDGRPYKSNEEIVKAGVPQKTVDKIKDLIVFGDPKAATAKTPPKPGMVWVNKDSKIYHKEGDRWYGKTLNGEWMTEEDAIKAGARLSK